MTLKETATLSKKSIRAYLLRGGAWAVAGKVLSSLSGLAFLGLLARLLKPEEMGLYFLLLNIATFFAIFGRGGMENTFLRFIAQANSNGEWQRLRELLSKGSVIVAAQILLSALILAICLPWLGQAVFNSNELIPIQFEDRFNRGSVMNDQPVKERIAPAVICDNTACSF